MAVKKVSKKVNEKKVTKVSSHSMTTLGFETIDESTLFSSYKDVFYNPAGNITEIGEMFLQGFHHFRQAKLQAENGEFRGDFTRDTFDSCNQFSKVLLQQGRVQLDADWNEQTSITAHHVRSLACDVGSEHWGPHAGAGFALKGVEDNTVGFLISPGHYYVNGIFCEVGLDDSNELITYVNQPYYTVPMEEMPDILRNEVNINKKKVLVYLDVWERHYNYISDDSIREVALGGPDTATRAKIIWQVKALVLEDSDDELTGDDLFLFKNNYQRFLEELSSIRKPGAGKLCAKVKDKSSDDSDPCLVAPESRYRGTENQLYRVEIHHSGVDEKLALQTDTPAEKATFKWSRENSSVIFPILEIQGDKIFLEHLGRDCRYGLKSDDWVEIVDDDLVLQCRVENLVQVDFVDEENRQIILKTTPNSRIGTDSSKHPYLRRWDHKEGNELGIPVKENTDGSLWFDLEDGIQVQFSDSNEQTGEEATGTINANYYQTGDYWLIPARTITGDIEWPRDIEGKAECVREGKAECVRAHGVIHHYAPLAVFGEDANGSDVSTPLRRILTQAWE